MKISPLSPVSKTLEKQYTAASNNAISLHTLWAQSDASAQLSPVFDALLRTLKTRFRVATALIFVAQKGAVALHMHAGVNTDDLGYRDAISLCRGQPDQLLVIEDVTGLAGEVLTPPPVRFYAGAPLVISVGGSPAGMLCLVDTKPRGFSSADRALLRSLANAVSALLLSPHNPQAAQAIALMAEKSVLLLGEAQMIEAANARFAQLTNFTVDDLLRTGIDDLLCLDRPNSGALLISHALLAGVPAQGMTRCHTKSGGTLPVEVFVFPLSDERGRVIKTLLLIAPLFSGPVEDFLLSLRSTERNELLSLHMAGLWSLDKAGLIGKLSGAPVAHLAGADLEDVRGKRLDSAGIFDAAHTDWREFYQSIAEDNLPDEVECCVTHNGHSQWYSMVGFKQYDARGQALGYHGSFRNITRRKLKETALRKAEQQQRLILKGTNDGAWDWDLETGDYYLSPRWWDMMGRDSKAQLPSALIWTQFIHPDDRASVSANFRAAVAQGRDAYQSEFRMLHQQGHYFPVLSRGHILYNPHGQAIRTSGTNQDLGPQRKAQTQIRLLEACVESLQDVVLITQASPRKSPGPIIVYVNPAFERFTGYSNSEAIGQTPRLLQGPQTCRLTLDKIADAMNSWQSVRCELANYKKSGELFWVELEIIPVKADGSNWYTHWIGVQRDVTARKQAEQVLRCTTERLTMALEGSDLGLWTSHLGRDDGFCDARWNKMLGLPPVDVTRSAKEWVGMVHPDDAAIVLGEQNAAVNSLDGTFEKEFRMRHADGRWLWIQSRGRVIERDADGKALVLAGTHLDVTAKVQSRLLSERLNAQLSRCLEHLNVGVILQCKGVIKFVNTTLLRIFGDAQFSDIVGTRFSQYILPADLDAAVWRQQQLMAGATPPSFWFNCVRTDGSVFKALTNSTVIEWEGEPHILSTMTPPGDAALLMEEVESVKSRYEGLLAKQLEEKQKHIAHELHDSLGSQLAGISLMAANIGAVGISKPQLAIEIGRLQVNIRQAAEMTRDLARGLVPVADWPGSFWRALERLCNDFNNSPALRCVFEMEGSFDDIHVDVGTHLYRIAQEAITNALRHGQATHIVVRLEHIDEHLVLCITDDGMGFDTTALQQNPGVGLSSIYARARAIGAEVDLVRQTPRGFCVTVRCQKQASAA